MEYPATISIIHSIRHNHKTLTFPLPFSRSFSHLHFLGFGDFELSCGFGHFGFPHPKFAVVDYLWHRKREKNASQYSEGLDVIDEWGRLVPEPRRWPSSKDGKGFKEVAKRVHDLGLKFGIHVMRGINVQAYKANTPILDPIKGGSFESSGRIWRARDIGMSDRRCKWMPRGFMSVNTDLAAGRAFFKSLYQQ